MCFPFSKKLIQHFLEILCPTTLILLNLVFSNIFDLLKKEGHYLESKAAQLKTGIFQIMSDNSAALNCFLCGETASDIKKLKFHLLLKHSNSNICLFCIEKKGWSSEFPRNAFNSFHFGLGKAIFIIIFDSD